MKHLADPRLSLQIDEEIELHRVLDIAFLCVQPSAEKRPNMARVVAMLQGDASLDVPQFDSFHDSTVGRTSFAKPPPPPPGVGTQQDKHNNNHHHNIMIDIMHRPLSSDGNYYIDGSSSTENSGNYSSALPSSSREFYRNSPVFIGSTPSGSRDSLLSSVSRMNVDHEMQPPR